VVLADEYARVLEDPSWTVRRTFQEIQASQRTRSGQDSIERKGSSKLADETVVLLLTVDEEGASVDPVSGTFAARELLPGLGQETNFRGLLPAHPVSPGSRWEVDVDALKELLIPGGELGLKDEDGRDVLETIGKLLGEDAVGSVELQFVEAQVGKALLSLRADVESSGCSPEVVIDDFSTGWGAADMVEQECFASRVYLEGNLLWDLDAGRLHELELDGDVMVRETTTTTLEWGSLLLSSIETWEGSLSVAASVEAGPP
jgi:hypothetical protein